MAKEICHVLFPGAFKPVHWGHISLMIKYLESSVYNTHLTIIISKSPREGLSAETSKWFLDKVFKTNKKVKVIIAPDPSPIKSVYDMICTKAYGPGIYSLGASSKGSDIKRTQDTVDQFAEGGKYETPGIKVIFFPINTEPILYKGRSDLYNQTPISATTVRNDVRTNNYEMFRTAYLPLLEEPSEYYDNISEDDLKIYYEKISAEILPVNTKSLNSSYITESLNILNEGGAAGHMQHPYDYSDFTFEDLKNLITDLFAGNIEDVTEKLDGQNLFASVDEKGNTIFARNETNLKDDPWYLDDIMNNPRWQENPSVLHAFSNGAITINQVFQNIPNKIRFFNKTENSVGQKYRYWANLEIIDMENFNVIPYADSKVSFHKFVGMSYSSSGWTRFDVPDDVNAEKMKVIDSAIKKTNKTNFKAQITPEVIVKKLDDGNKKAETYINYIDNLINSKGFSDSITINEYKTECMKQYISKEKSLNWISGDVLSALLDRWIKNVKTPNIKYIYKNLTLENGEYMTDKQYDIVHEFETSKSKDLVIKKIMKPLDTLFIKVGNDILKHVSGLTNAGHEKEVQNKLKSTLSDIRKTIEKSDDKKLQDKLATSLSRLAEVNNELNSTEGIVFRWKGRIMKLTGSFAPLNQILGVSGVNLK